MSSSLSRREALLILGVPLSADDRTVKQAYRHLARQHHPDRGGDPSTFHRLQLAYERLSTDGSDSGPAVSRGRPSRPGAPHTSDHDRADLDSIEWTAEVPDGEIRLSRDRLAVLLAADTSTLQSLTATSRCPGSRLNAIAAKLSPAFTAWLTVGPRTDDLGRSVVAMEVTAANRRARRAVDSARLDDLWTRTRRSTSSRLHSTLVPSPDTRTTAVMATARVAALLDTLGWPLDEWTLTAEGP